MYPQFENKSPVKAALKQQENLSCINSEFSDSVKGPPVASYAEDFEKWRSTCDVTQRSHWSIKHGNTISIISVLQMAELIYFSVQGRSKVWVGSGNKDSERLVFVLTTVMGRDHSP